MPEIHRVFIAATVCLLATLSTSKRALPQTVPTGFEVMDINTDLADDAIGFALLPDGRVLVIHQFSGEVKLLVEAVLKADALLTVPHLAAVAEKGLLGIAVDPDFPQQPYVYLFHTFDDDPDQNRVSRFTVTGELTDSSSDNLSINPASQMVLVSDMTAESNRHNGGTLRFAPDKTLLISHGDDKNRSKVQDLTTLKGKILRINRDGSVPDDNPVFSGEPTNRRPEIFAIGLRNPFRFAVDPCIGELFVSDVGERSREEIDLLSPDGGENLGWPRYEGTLDFDTNADLIPPTPTFPIWEYHREGENSVIALAAYRQQNTPNDFSFPDEYDGTLFYADFYDDTIYNLRSDNGGWTSVEFATGFGNNPIDGALGKDGAIYILEYGHALRKIVFLNNPVPVELVSFSATLIEQSVVLTWQTASETNNYGFEVQRRRNGEDFMTIAFVKGQVNSTHLVRYRYEDDSPGDGKFYYRLKQIDLDGGFEYSSELLFNIPLPDDLILLQNYPNPFNNHTKIVFTIPDLGPSLIQTPKVVLAVFNTNGHIVKTIFDQIKLPGRYTATWDGTNQAGRRVASGIYMYSLSFDNHKHVKKMLYIK